MAFTTPKGWDKESETLFIHESGTRVERRTYREKDGWFIIPVDLDQEVVGYDPTPEGRDKAFQDFADGKIKTARKPKKAAEPEGPPKPKRGRKPKERLPAEEGEEGAEPGAPPPAAEEGEEGAAADKDKEDKEDKDEDEDEDEGDEA
jgi:hypothetical protein